MNKIAIFNLIVLMLLGVVIFAFRDIDLSVKLSLAVPFFVAYLLIMFTMIESSNHYKIDQQSKKRLSRE